MPYTTLLTATRFLANSFRHDSLRSALYNAPSDLYAVLRAVSIPATHSNKLVRLAAATVVLNAAVLLSGGGGAAAAAAPDLAKVFFELAVEMIRFIFLVLLLRLLLIPLLLLLLLLPPPLPLLL